MKIFICICWFMRYYIIHLLFSFQAAWNTHLCVSKMESKMRSLRFLGWLSVLVTQTCLTLCDPLNYSLPGSSVHPILQTRIMEWVAIPFSRGSSQLGDWIWVSLTTGGYLMIWATTEALRLTKDLYWKGRQVSCSVWLVWLVVS